ncbi:probable F420-dependent oxidoreductase, Rv3520c family [Ferrithrix thermotolerans DSM 19514]|uniref:Probable F420-dependent oxidoreductase, Rv3520c family n=2 Tax=Ferrithrix TaxID=643949 RepID=A0A1M4S4V6_9ACTN|nr:LLM class F420-dependent oxidoreductase [Ferrithrix thermotolerans]SHE27231.1 probable F420-dependent oxidoreductase, Rv3520c family [Ferrithrix thermotolerans DSM 19514]
MAQISMQLNYAGNKSDVIKDVLEYEARGLDVVWIPEAYSFDAPSAMGFLAAVTKTIKIGSGILPIYSRTPALIAMTAAAVDELSGGRMILGLGSSGPQVIEGWHGVPYDKPLARTREVVEICRSVWRREPLVHHGLYEIPLPPEKGTGLGKPLKLINHPLRSTIPIYIAAIGPKNVEMAAEIAEGWLPIFFVPEYKDRVWKQAIDKGLSRRSDELGAFDIVAGGLLAIGDDVEHLLDLARPQVALYVGGMGAKGKNFYNDLAKRYGFEREAEEIQELYLAGKKDEAAKAVPSELLRLSNFVGPRGYIEERVAAFKEAGVGTFSVTPVGKDKYESFSIFRELTL